MPSFDKIKGDAPSFLVLLGLSIKFGLVAAGPSCPDFAAPTYQNGAPKKFGVEAPAK